MVVLVVVLVVVALVLPATAPAQAARGSSSAERFECAADVYSVNGETHLLSRLDPTTGTFSANGIIPAGKHDDLNALALPGRGRYIHAFDRTKNQIVRFDADTNDAETWDAPANPNASSVIAGAINPATGIYYYAAGGSAWRLFAFDTNTNTSIGRVGTISGLSVNGDMAFDAVGNLYVVSNDTSRAGTLARVNGPLPTTAGDRSLLSTVLASLPVASQYASMAFDGSGLLVIGTSTGQVLRVNPSSGERLSVRTVALSLSDMASCSSPSTASVRVDLPQGRHDAADQFGTRITGGGVDSGNTGVTNGTDVGPQTQESEVAGPVVVLSGGTYTITQTAAGGTDLDDYATTWKCVHGSDGSTISSGAGNGGTFAVPAGAGTTVACTFTDLPLNPAIHLEKAAGAISDQDGNGPDAGDRIAYIFTVSNIGNVGLAPVTVTDGKVGTVTCPPGAITPGTSTTCTGAPYVLTQADVDAGRVDNTAAASGTAPNGVVVTDTDSASVVVPAMPAIEVDKSAGALVDNDRNGPGAGDTITYSFSVTNRGNVTLTSIAVNDPKLGGTIPCPSTALAPGASMACPGRTYSLTQDDVNAGKVENTATVTGTTPTRGHVTDDDSTTTGLQGTAAIELHKTAGAIGDLDHNGADAGDTITYAFEVTNVGTRTLDPVTVSDVKLGTVVCPAGGLVPGGSRICTAAAYVLTQADVDAGDVENSATATGTPPGGADVTDADSATTRVPPYPGLVLEKTASPVDDADANGPDAGDAIAYDFEVTNTGNVTLDRVTVADPRVGPVTCPSAPLTPGSTVSCSSTAYLLTQADVDAGEVVNTATASGTPPTGPPVTDTDSSRTTIEPRPRITLVKTASPVHDVNGNGIDDGDTVTYGFEVTNTGNVTLAGVAVADPKVGPVTCPPAPLAPGATVECDPRTYALTQDDVDRGSVDNTATVIGTAPSGATVTDDDTRTVDLPRTGSIQLSKTASSIADLDGDGPDAGDTITYSFRVTNSGNVKLDPVTVTDPKVGPVTCPSGGLDPDESLDCTDVAYTITRADVDAATVDNTATATGRTPDGGTVQDSDSTTTPVQPTVTNVTVRKRVSDASPRVGDLITYTLTVTNTGAADADDVVVTDVLPNGVTYVSADAPCDRSVATVHCELGTVPAGATRTVDVQVRVDPLPEVGADHQHLFDVQKTEVHVDVEADDQATGTVSCMPGYVVSDGSGRLDHVDQGTGTLADLHMTENHAVGDGGWRARFVNDAAGRAQAKVFAVCIRTGSEVVNGHSHHLLVGDPISETHPLPHGRTELTMTCAPGQTPIQPGYALDGSAPVLTTYPSGAGGWTWGVVNDGDATTGTFTLRCLDTLVSTANGHTHGLGLDEVRQHVTVPAGQEAESTLSCAGDAKGIVAGYDVDDGLVVLGNDPRPIVRVFRLYNPTGSPLGADLRLLCLANRTAAGADRGRHVVNTATVSTSTPETSATDNGDSATIQVDDSRAVVPAALVTVSSTDVAAIVRCGAGGGTCSGRATLLAASDLRVGGHVVQEGSVLAKGAYRIRSGTSATLHLRKTALGRKALGSEALRRAKLRIGGETRTVRIRH